MRAILLDIEGTTTPIDFVLEVLFPYSTERIPKYVEAHFSELHNEINRLVEERSKDRTYTLPVDPTEPGSVASYLKFLIDKNQKSTPLKSIQGEIWRSGYESGELTSIVYDDVPAAFQRWTEEDTVVAIFSSGSVLAQRLLFRYTNHGDLTQHISSYFDTHIGSKSDPASYAAIALELKFDPDEILFVSDIIDELDAARESGLLTALTVRPGNAVIEEDVAHRIITTFDDLD